MERALGPIDVWINNAMAAVFSRVRDHRGSIWPVENGSFAVGFFRFGLCEHLHRLAKAIFEAPGCTTSAGCRS